MTESHDAPTPTSDTPDRDPVETRCHTCGEPVLAGDRDKGWWSCTDCGAAAHPDCVGEACGWACADCGATLDDQALTIRCCAGGPVVCCNPRGDRQAPCACEGCAARRGGEPSSVTAWRMLSRDIVAERVDPAEEARHVVDYWSVRAEDPALTLDDTADDAIQLAAWFALFGREIARLTEGLW